MTTSMFAAALLLAGSAALGGQVPGTAAKRAAQNAANATNAHIARETGQQVPARVAPTPAASRPAAAKPVAPKTTVQQPAASNAGAKQPTPKSASPGRGDSLAAPGADSTASGGGPANRKAGERDSVLVYRETFEYARDGRRDPFVSLMTTSDLRPTLSDLQLTSVLYDQSGRRPIAIMRDNVAKVQWRVTTGMSLGRMRVAAIRPKVVVFTIEEFGFSRQDSLVIGDTTRVRSK